MRWILFFMLALTLAGRGQDLAGDMTLHRLLIDGEDWQLVADGLGFADGPCSDTQGNFYFSDMKAPGIFRIGLEGGKTKLVDEPASGLKFGADGQLYACQGGKHRVIAINVTTGKVSVVMENVQPNDLVITRENRIYITETGKKQVTLINPGWHFKLPFDTAISAPNGITLSPDEGTLAVSDYGGENVWTFQIEADGSLRAEAPYMTMRRPIDPKGTFEMRAPPPFKKAAGGDGMTTDTEGRFYVATALGVQIFDATGRLCGVLSNPQKDKPLTSCTLAGPGAEFLYVTNGDKIFRRKVQAVGAAFRKAVSAAAK
jgi:enterochelin esterase family protein